MDEIRKIPPVTRSIIGGVLLVTIPILLHLTSAYPIVFVPRRITTNFELWRIVTPFLYGGGGIAFLFDMFLIFRNSSDLEERHFGGRTAEYAWALFIFCSGIIATNIPLGSPIFFRAFLVGLTHLWAQTNATSKVSLFGLINMSAPYFPFALVAIDLLTKGPPSAIQSFTGIASAHLYYFLSVIYPGQNNGRPLPFLAPPAFLINFLGNGTPPPGSAPAAAGARPGGWVFRGGNPLGARPGAAGGIRGAAPEAVAGGGGAGGTAREARAGGTYRWGSGQRLGEE